jgi:hypothetical protein
MGGPYFCGASPGCECKLWHENDLQFHKKTAWQQESLGKMVIRRNGFRQNGFRRPANPSDFGVFFRFLAKFRRQYDLRQKNNVFDENDPLNRFIRSKMQNYVSFAL